MMCFVEANLLSLKAFCFRSAFSGVEKRKRSSQAGKLLPEYLRSQRLNVTAIATLFLTRHVCALSQSHPEDL